MSKLPIKQKGLFRCCFGEIGEYKGPEEEGTTLECKRCGGLLIIENETWKWNEIAEAERYEREEAERARSSY